MAKATHASTPQNLSIQQAAAAIAQLINEKPTSPRQEEIAAIIAKAVLSHQEPAPDPRLMEWRERVATFRAAVEAAVNDDDDAVVDAALGALSTRSHAIWATPVRTFADLMLRAEIAQEWNSPGSIGDPEYPLWVLQHKDPSIDDLALAHVVQAVLEIGGRQL